MIESTGGPFEGFMFIIGQYFYWGISGLFLLLTLLGYAMGKKWSLALLGLCLVPALIANRNYKANFSYENPRYAQVVEFPGRINICTSRSFNMPHFCNRIGESGMEGNELIAYAKRENTIFFLSAGQPSDWDQDQVQYAFFIVDEHGEVTYFRSIRWFDAYASRRFGVSHQQLKWKNLLREFDQRGKVVRRIHEDRAGAAIDEFDEEIARMLRLSPDPRELNFVVRRVYPNNLIEIHEQDGNKVRKWYVHLKDIRLPHAYETADTLWNIADLKKAEFIIKDQEPCGIEAHEFLSRALTAKQVVIEVGPVLTYSLNFPHARIYLKNNRGELRSLAEMLCAAGYAKGCDNANGPDQSALKQAADRAQAGNMGIYGNGNCSTDKTP